MKTLIKLSIICCFLTILNCKPANNLEQMENYTKVEVTNQPWWKKLGYSLKQNLAKYGIRGIEIGLLIFLAKSANDLNRKIETPKDEVEKYKTLLINTLEQYTDLSIEEQIGIYMKLSENGNFKSSEEHKFKLGELTRIKSERIAKGCWDPVQTIELVAE